MYGQAYAKSCLGVVGEVYTLYVIIGIENASPSKIKTVRGNNTGRDTLSRLSGDSDTR